MVDRSTISVAGLADGAAGADLLDADGAVRDSLVAVALGPAPANMLAAAAHAAAASDRVLVGVTDGPLDPVLRPLVEALDLTLVPVAGGPAEIAVPDPYAEAAELRGRAETNPQAATVLAGLLRWSVGLPVPAALDAESFAYSTLLGGREFARWLATRGPRPLPPPVEEPVRVARDGGELRVTLNRPERRNAYGRDVRDAFVAALQIADLDAGVERVILSGTGPLFSAGGDIDEFGTAHDLATAHLVRTRGGAGRLLHRLAARVEVRVHGRCVGAGVELPAFAGRVVAHPDTTFRLPEVAMGLVPGAGGTVGIPRRIGRWRTLHLALTGRPIDAATALDWGLVDALA